MIILKQKKIKLNSSEKILNFYDEWYDEYLYQNKIEEINTKCNLEIMSSSKEYL